MTINDRPPAAPQKKLGAHGYQFPTPKAPQAPHDPGAKAMPGAPIPPERRPVAPPVAAPPSPAPAVETAEQVEAPAERIATGYDAARGVYTYDDDPPAPPAPARQTAPEPVQRPTTPATPIAPPAETEAATAPLAHPLAGVDPAEFPRASQGPEAVARWYLNRGLIVFPVCAPTIDGKCTGKVLDDHKEEHKRGKHPTRKWGGAGKLRVMEEDDIVNAWRRFKHNTALPCGRNGGGYTVVLDLDGPEGERTIKAAEEVLGALPATLVSTTGKGRHLLFAAPPGLSAEELTSVKATFACVCLDASRRLFVTASRGAPSSFDLRADGGYIVAPGSKHASGAEYRANGSPIAPLPRAWWDALPRREGTASGRPKSDASNPLPLLARGTGGPSEAERTRLYFNTALPGILAEIRTETDTPDSPTNDTINAKSLRAFRLALGAGVDLATVHDQLVAAGEDTGHPRASVRATVASAQRAAEEKGPEYAPDRPAPGKASAGKGKSSSSGAGAAAPRRTEEDTTRQGGGEGPPASNARPVIELRADVHEVEAEAVAALAAAGLYQREPSGLVEVVVAPDLAPDVSARTRLLSPDPGLPILQPIGAPRLRSILSERAMFMRYDARRREVVHVPPPRDIIEGVLARKTYPTSAARPLRSVVESPVMRPDGSVFEAPGPGDHYDPATNILLRWRGPALGIPERPTLDDARASFGRLARLFAQFVFTGDERRRGASLAATIAAILTPIARPSIEGPVPAFVWTADRENAGKSLAAKVCGLIAMGRAPSARPWPVGEGEMAKVLTIFALTSLPVGLFDDTCHAIGGGDFDAAVTAWPNYSPRILGTNTSPVHPWVTTLYVTANGAEARNPSAAGRLVFVELFGRGRGEHARAATDEREYKIPKLARHAQENRPAYLRDALTILRAYQLAGSPRPAGARRRDSFEEWSERVAWPLLWCSGFSPVEAHAPAGADAQGETMRAVVIAWREAFGIDADGITAAELREQVMTADPARPAGLTATVARARAQLRGLLADLCEVPNISQASARAVGKHLARVAGLRIDAPDGARLVIVAKENRNGVKEYTLTRQEVPGPMDAGFAGFAGSESTAPRGNCQGDTSTGEGDDGGQFAGESAGSDPANPANPASPPSPRVRARMESP